MMILITGVPGTGKSTVSKFLSEKINAKLVNINTLAEDNDLFMGTDEIRGYKIVNIEGMIDSVEKIRLDNPDDTIIFEGHLAQDYPNSDYVIVLRCDPLVLKERLNTRDWKDKKVKENVSAEILGVCTSEAYDTYGDMIQEVDTTNLSVEEVANQIMKIVNGDISHPAGSIDFLSDYFSLLD